MLSVKKLWCKAVTQHSFCCRAGVSSRLGLRAKRGNYTLSTNMTRSRLQLDTRLRRDGRSCHWSCVLPSFLDTAALQRHGRIDQLLKHFCSTDLPEPPKGKSFQISWDQYYVSSLGNKEREVVRAKTGSELEEYDSHGSQL